MIVESARLEDLDAIVELEGNFGVPWSADSWRRELEGEGRLVLIAADPADNPVAFIDLEDDGHIDMLFCTPGWAGRGVASALYRELETLARRQNMKHLHVEASEIARPFFARHGFTLTRRNDFEIGGVAIHHYTMEKPLLQVRA